MDSRNCLPIGLRPVTAKFEVQVLGEELSGIEISALLHLQRAEFLVYTTNVAYTWAIRELEPEEIVLGSKNVSMTAESEGSHSKSSMHMNILGFFRRKGKSSPENSRPKIEFGFRLEGITYILPDRSADVWFTWMDGARIYTETIAKWKNGLPLTRNEKERVFNEILRFVVQKAERPIIVINEDDPSKKLWEQLCSANQSVIKNIEYTSREEETRLERSMYLGFIKAGKKVVLDGTEIANEKELDEAMLKRRKNRP